jgi:hypothetical protein
MSVHDQMVLSLDRWGELIERYRTKMLASLEERKQELRDEGSSIYHDELELIEVSTEIERLADVPSGSLHWKTDHTLAFQSDEDVSESISHEDFKKRVVQPVDEEFVAFSFWPLGMTLPKQLLETMRRMCIEPEKYLPGPFSWYYDFPKPGEHDGLLSLSFRTIELLRGPWEKPGLVELTDNSDPRFAVPGAPFSEMDMQPFYDLFVNSWQWKSQHRRRPGRRGSSLVSF